MRDGFSSQRVSLPPSERRGGPEERERAGESGGAGGYERESRLEEARLRPAGRYAAAQQAVYSSEQAETIGRRRAGRGRAAVREQQQAGSAMLLYAMLRQAAAGEAGLPS